ncbi:glycosyltransferase family 4 protein [Thomasclavelia spiroformis]|uniref:glycosyltransferase family 4 protein n=1 Tax=Thomasclavelia spiroformis TaxID=29348 RepID=UPI0032092DC1
MDNNVLFVLDGPSPYRVKFLNLLSKQMNIFVVFSASKTKQRVDGWLTTRNIDFDYIVLDDKNCEENKFSLKLVKFLMKNRFKSIVICNPTNLSSICGMYYLKIKRINYSIEIDGAFYRKNFIKNIIKKSVFYNAKYALSPNYLSDIYLVKNGVKYENIIRYPFSSLMEKDIKNISINDKVLAKTRIGIKNKLTLLFVGSFSVRKNVLKTAELLMKLKYIDFQALFIGAGPLKEELLSLTSKDSRISIIKHMDYEDLKQYYNASDIFILLTNEDIWGLVINEALSHGLFCITTSRCGAAQELIQNEKVGYIVKDLTEYEIEKGINQYLKNKNRVIPECIKIAKEYTIENMVKKHIDLFMD